MDNVTSEETKKNLEAKITALGDAAEIFAMGQILSELFNEHKTIVHELRNALKSNDKSTAHQHTRTLLESPKGRELTNRMIQSEFTGTFTRSMGTVGFTLGGEFMAAIVGGAVEGGVAFRVDDNLNVQFDQPWLYGAAGIKFGIGLEAAFELGFFATTAYPESLVGGSSFAGGSVSVDAGIALGVLWTEGEHSGIHLYAGLGAGAQISFTLGKEATSQNF